MGTPRRDGWGEYIRQARRAQHMTQDQVAEASGITRRTFGDIERGRVVPQAATLERILAVLGLKQEEPLAHDVELFLSALGPLLNMLEPQARAEVTPRLVRAVTDRLTASSSAEETAARQIMRDALEKGAVPPTKGAQTRAG